MISMNNNKPVIDKPIHDSEIERIVDPVEHIKKNLKKGEVICSKCKGIGLVFKIKSNKGIIFKNECPKCQGTGKLDWIENVVGKKPMYYDGTSIPNISFTK